MSTYEESAKKKVKTSSELEVVPLLPIYSSYIHDKWKALPGYTTQKIYTLKDLLCMAWNSADHKIRSLIPILAEINDLVGLWAIKEWVVNIVLYVMTYESITDDKMFMVKLTGVESKTYVASLIKRLYKKLNVGNLVKIEDERSSECQTDQVLWCFDIPRYTNKQLYEIFVKMLQKDGWSMESLEKIDSIDSVTNASFLLRLCKLCRAKRIFGVEMGTKMISKEDFYNAVEMYKKIRKPSTLFSY